MSPTTTLSISKESDVTVLAFGADYRQIGEDMISDLEAELFAAAETADPPLVVVDLSQTALFSSAFIEFLIRIGCRLTRGGKGKFALAGLSPQCARMVEFACLDQIFEIFKSRAEAVRTLAGCTYDADHFSS